MGDDSPSAYWENIPGTQHDGVAQLVVRGSALGTCLWELLAILQGHEPRPWPARMLRAFQEGHDGEAAVLAGLEADGWVLDHGWDQRKLELSCGAGRLVRLHPDSAGCPPSQPTTPHVIEVKRLHNQTWQGVRRHGIRDLAAIRKALGATGEAYAWQWSAEMAATRMPLAVVIENKGETPDENGNRPPCKDQGALHIDYLTEAPYSRADIIRRVRELAAAADEDVVAAGRPCDNPDQWPCRFVHLRPVPDADKGEPVDADDLDEYEAACALYDRGRALEGRGKKMKDRAKETLLKLGSRGEQEDGSVLYAEALFTDRWAVPIVRGERTVTDWEAMRAEFDVDSYQHLEPQAVSVRVNRR